MGEVEAAGGCTRVHRQRLGQTNPGRRLDIEQLPEQRLLGVVGRGRIARGRTDPAVFLGDQIRLRQVFVLAVVPLAADAFMEVFRECLGQTIGERR